MVVVTTHNRAATKYIVPSEQIFDKIAGIGKIRGCLSPYH
jgi:hypothetical protein